MAHHLLRPSNSNSNSDGREGHDDSLIDNNNNNTTRPASSDLDDHDYDKLFRVCWKRQSCGSCLAGGNSDDDDDDNDEYGDAEVECGWCPFVC